MLSWAQPKLVISKCLCNVPCRYNGEASSFDLYTRLKSFVNFIEVCPEVAIGLPTPREVVRLIKEDDSIKLIQHSSLEDYTEDMVHFSKNFTEELKDVHGFLFKSRSPSCGTRDVKIYLGREKSSMTTKGRGILGGLIYDKFNFLPIEEDGRLKNYTIRDHFLTRIFTLAEFSKISELKDIGDLINYHSKHKLLFMSYNQTELKKLGRIVANHEGLPAEETINTYYIGLLKLLSRTPRYTSNINVYIHALGYFSEYLTSNEKNFMLSIIDRYRAGKVPLSVPLNLLKSNAIRFNNQYLLEQSFLEPYPEELIDISDSGKGINK